MKIKSLIIQDDKQGFKNKKRLTALFTFEDGKKKTLNFGSYKSYTYFDSGDVKLRQAYKSRHSKLNENWYDITTRGALSYHVLWAVESNNEIEKRLNRLFKIPVVKVNITKNKKNK
jgi:hypothetical protein